MALPCPKEEFPYKEAVFCFLSTSTAFKILLIYIYLPCDGHSVVQSKELTLNRSPVVERALESSATALT